MSLRFRNKTENGNGYLSKKKSVAKGTNSQDLGLKGSNMQINIRLGSNRVYETGKPLISACKSEDCLQASLRRETLTTRKILSDRPATAGYGLTNKSKMRYPYSSIRRPVGGSSTSREDNSVATHTKLQPRDWAPPISSQSWSSSVDSELATVGSFDTEGSLEDKQSFAVFSGDSCDSREHLVPNTIHRDIDHQVFTDNPTQHVSQSESICRFSSPSHEEPNASHNFSTKMENDNRIQMSHRSQSDVAENEFKSKDRLTVTNAFSLNSSIDQILAIEDNTKTFDHIQTLSAKETTKQIGAEAMSKEEQDKVFVNDSVDDVSSIRTPSADEISEELDNHESLQVTNQKQETINKTRESSQTIKTEPNMLSEILNFLDDASQATNNSPLPIINSETESNAGFARPASESMRKLHGMSMTQLTEEVLSLQMLVQDKDNKLMVLEGALQHQRELLARNVKTAKRELNLRCKSQKEEYEATLNRHVQFIQQLVEEKKALAVKCEGMAAEMRQQASKLEYERRISEDRLNNEIRRLKQNLGKDQRFQQEKWLADRTEHIREATARGLEPELRRLMGQHQTELQSLRSIHQEELMRIEQTHLNKTVQQLNALREKMDNDREEACAKEREIMRAKYDKQLDEMEAIHVSKCQRIQVEMERERARWLEEESRMKSQEEEKFRRLEDKRRREKAAAHQLMQSEIETIKATHSEHIAQLRKKWEGDKNEELSAVRHAMEISFNERERHLQETQRRQRDDDAQKFNTHFANELKRQHEQWKLLSENEIQRLREKSSEEIKRLDQNETELRNKLTEIRRAVSERDEELAALRLSLFQQVKENKDIKVAIEQYVSERSDLRKVLQKELDDEFLRLNEDKRSLQEEIIRMKSEHRLELNKKNSEIANLSSSHEQTLGDIHEKVKQAVSKKDDSLAQMQDRLKTAIARCQHLEELLDRQQKDLFARKH